MWKDEVLAQPVVPYAERRIRIEAEPLPDNIGALIDVAAKEAGDQLLWNFFESGETITYAEMRRVVNGLAAKLVGLGITKGSHVGVMLPNIAAFPLTWLALGRVGAVMLPINPGYTPREIAHVMKVAEAEWVVTHASTRATLDQAHAEGLVSMPPERMIVVGGEVAQGSYAWETLAAEPAERFDAPELVGHDDLLNIQFTSGTSGFPKGCMLSQRYWISAGKVNAFRDGRVYRRILASTPFFYMDPQWLLLMTIYQRGTLFVAAKQSTSRFTTWLKEHEIEFCLLPWVLHGMAPQAHDAENRVVRANIYGCPRDLHKAIEARFDLNAREAFGMTEVGPAMFAPIERADKVGSGSCGLPCPFRECRIVDETGNPVPQGEIGELQIRGPGIMLGYYNNPEATAEVLKGGWFSTGDLFRQDEEGFFYIVGRKKDMIRRSAENIAAREVETVLAAAPGVAEVAVVGVPDPLRGEEVKAYLKLKEGVDAGLATLEAVIATAQAGLAAFKVPRFYTFVEEFPRTASLKIAKPRITTGIGDLRAGSYDRTTGQWIEGAEFVKPHYDAIIVGGGHNGLTCGAYLSRAGVKVLVVERREIIGGAAVTEEIAPGYRSSIASYYQGLLQPKVILDLELQKYGFEVLPAPPTVFALEGDRTFTMWDDPEKFAAEIAKFSNIDGGAYARYRAHMQKIAPHMKQLLWEVPVNPASGKIRDLKRLAGFVWRFRKIGPQFYDIYNLLTMSAYDYLSRWFKSEDVKLVLGFFAGGGGANSSLKTPGSAYMLARGIVRDGNTAAGPAGFMKGGMGAISEAIRRSGEAHGMVVRTNCPVERILVENGRAVGVRLEGGEELRSKIVIANATARTIFTKLLDPAILPEEFNRDIENIRCESTVFRVNLALASLPHAPVFGRSRREGGVVPQMTIAPSVAYMERAYRQSQGGEIADEPFLIVKVPSLVDPTLAPEGHHIMNIFGGHAPYTLARGTWEERREELWAKVLEVLKTHFPDIEDHILHRQVITPLDLERIFDLPNGHVHHGEISADQMFFRRHSPNYADYRSPIEGLYQASASVHPGGGVTGVPGHNAAKVILEDRRKWS